MSYWKRPNKETRKRWTDWIFTPTASLFLHLKRKGKLKDENKKRSSDK